MRRVLLRGVKAGYFALDEMLGYTREVAAVTGDRIVEA